MSGWICTFKLVTTFSVLLKVSVNRPLFESTLPHSSDSQTDAVALDIDRARAAVSEWESENEPQRLPSVQCIDLGLGVRYPVIDQLLGACCANNPGFSPSYIVTEERHAFGYRGRITIPLLDRWSNKTLSA